MWNGDKSRRQSPRVGVWVAVAVLATSISLLILVQAAFSVMVADARENLDIQFNRFTVDTSVNFLDQDGVFLSVDHPDRPVIDQAAQDIANSKRGVRVFSGPVGQGFSFGFVLTKAQLDQINSGAVSKEKLVWMMTPGFYDSGFLVEHSYVDMPANPNNLPTVGVAQKTWEAWGKPSEVTAWRGQVRFSPLGQPEPVTKRFVVIPISLDRSGIVLDERSWDMWSKLGRGEWLANSPLGPMNAPAEKDWEHSWHGAPEKLKEMKKEMESWLEQNKPSWRMVSQEPSAYAQDVIDKMNGWKKTTENNIAVLVRFQYFLLVILGLVIAVQSGWTLRWLCRQRQADIAVLKTLGWSSKEVTAAFVFIALGVGVASALCGWVLGMAWVDIGNYINTHWGTKLRLVSQPMSYPGAQELVWVVMSIGWISLAALFPAWRAAQQNPAMLFARDD